MTRNPRSNAFTLVELLAVIATVVVLSTLLLPAMAGIKVRTQVAGCLNNQKQLGAGWRMYADDNQDNLVGMGDGGTNCLPPNWIWRPSNGQCGLWFNNPALQATNSAQACKGSDEWGYQKGALCRYVPNVDVIHCPGDGRLNSVPPFGPGYRSYSGANGYGQLQKVTDVIHPSARFLWIEDGDVRGTATVRVGKSTFIWAEDVGTWYFKTTVGENPTPPDFSNVDGWYDAPAMFHINGTVLSWADGHSSEHKWLSTYTLSFGHYPAAGRDGEYDYLKVGNPPTALWYQDLQFLLNAYVSSSWP